MGTAKRVAVALALCICLAAHARPPRDPAQVRAFRSEHPCPATGLKRGACPGWDVDHIIPLCAGGADHPSNLQWLNKEDHKWKTFVDVRECRKERAHRTALSGPNE